MLIENQKSNLYKFKLGFWFLGNVPILYVDPDGRTEYITIKQIHLRMGQLSIVTYKHVKADRYMASGEMRKYGPYSTGYNPFKREYNYYDFKTEITETYAENGRLLISSAPKSEILMENGITHRETHLFFSPDKGDIIGDENITGVYTYGNGGSGYKNGPYSSQGVAKSSIDLSGGLMGGASKGYQKGLKRNPGDPENIFHGGKSVAAWLEVAFGLGKKLFEKSEEEVQTPLDSNSSITIKRDTNWRYGVRGRVYTESDITTTKIKKE